MSEVNKLSRRDFVKGSTLLAATVALERLFTGVPFPVESILQNPELVDLAFSVMKQHFLVKGSARIRKEIGCTPEENPHLKPLKQTISQAVQLYGKKVSYAFSEKRKDDAFWFEKMDQLGPITLDELLKMATGSLIGLNIVMDFHEVLKDEQFATSYGLNNLLIYSRNGIDSFETLSKLESSSFFGLSDLEISQRILKVVKFLEDRGRDAPVNSDTLLSHFLEINHGDLAYAIEDLAVFYRVYARNDLNTGQYFSDIENGDTDMTELHQGIKVARYSFIQDEYLAKGEHFMENIRPNGGSDNPDLDRNNLIGCVYHAWSTIAALRVLPPETAGLTSVLRIIQRAYYNQGFFKSASIINVAQQLKEVEELFLSLENS